MDRLTDIVYLLWREMPIVLGMMLYGDVDTSVVGEVTATQE